MMMKLGERNYAVLEKALKTVGLNDPDETLEYCFEQLYVDEYEIIKKFIHWVYNNKKYFGWGNYEERYQEFLKDQGLISKTQNQIELTQEQIERQDFVDNTIYQCLRELCQSKSEISYNGEVVGKIRDIISDYFVDDLKLMTEQEFYPYIEIESKNETVENNEKVTTEISIIWCDEDVRATIDEMNEDEDIPIELSDKEVGEVLDNLKRHHDCELGISWESLRCEIKEVVSNQKIKG